MNRSPVVPPSEECVSEDTLNDDVIHAVMALASARFAILTGAGLSTESGIPDYRGPETRRRARNPVRFAEFVRNEHARRRYWARATLGWPTIRDAQPNDAHRALAALGQRKRAVGVITQNVDGLDAKAGSARVVELHGALRDVICLECDRVSSREDVHAELVARNPRFASRASLDVAPDGDVELSDDDIAEFRVVACACGGPLKPRVVYFGENVPAEVLADAWRIFEDADALLVAGTSLEVFSGRRFVDEARRRGRPIVIVNHGPTRSDAYATVRIEGRVGDVLPRLAAAL